MVTLICFKCLCKRIDFYITFKGCQQLSLLVIKSQVWKIPDPVKRWQQKFRISSYPDIWIMMKLVVSDKTFYLRFWLVGSENDLVFT